MSGVDALIARRSVPPEFLAEPGPDAAQLGAALDAALRAPDHGRLQPWRFRLVRSAAARREFGELLASTALARDPATPGTQLEKLRTRPLRTPLVIIVTAQLRAHPKVPEIEQLLAAGAGAMNLLNAFHLQGYGAIWLTGPGAYDPAVAAALGCGPAERIVGFVYVGSVVPGLPTAPARPQRAALVSDWPPVS